MARRCQLTGKRRNVANKVSHANNKVKSLQQPNLQRKRLWLESQKRFVRVKLSTRALRTITRIGLDRYLSDLGMKLSDLR